MSPNELNLSDFVLGLGLGAAIVGFVALSLTFSLVRKRRAGDVEPSTPQGVALSAPIRELTFEDSLDPIKFASAAERQALKIGRLYFPEFQAFDPQAASRGIGAADATNLGLNALRQMLGRFEMVVEPTAEGKRALAAGQATVAARKTGEKFGQLRDVNGKIFENMREVGGWKKALRITGSTTTLIVSLAHLISAADLARTLGAVDRKVDLLLALRRMDQSARLERIYYEAQELLQATIDEFGRHRLWSLRGDLRELRTTWRLEAEHHLKLITNPAHADFVERTFSFQSSIDDKVEQGLAAGRAHILYLEYSLRLDRLLAVACDSWEPSFASLQGELDAFERLARLLDKKSGYLSKERRTAVDPFTDGVRKIVEVHRRSLFPPWTAQVLGSSHL